MRAKGWSGRAGLGGAMAALALLGACAEQGATTEPVNAAATRPGTGDEGRARIDFDACEQPAENRFTVSIAGQVLAVPAAAVGGALPRRLAEANPANPSDIDFQDFIEPGEGCPERPLEVVSLRLQEQTPQGPLQGIYTLQAVPPQSIAELRATARRLQAERPQGLCRPVGQDVLGCLLREVEGEGPPTALYLITADPAQRLPSGGPVTGRCIFQGQQIAACTVVETLAPGVVYTAVMKPADYTTAILASAHTSARQRLSPFLR